MTIPLDGLIVVSLEQAVAAPFATRQLADLGARVIKIERPDVGDFARGYDETVRGLASHFVWLNRSKESVALDLKSDARPGGDAGSWSDQADVFVQNLAPGAAERLGLGCRRAARENPRLIHVSISGYGAGGPYSAKKAYDLLVQCEAGLVSITGTEDEPSKVGISIADIASGMYAYTGILTALHPARAHRRGSDDRGLDARSARGVDGLSAELRHVRRARRRPAPARGTRRSRRTARSRAATASRCSSASRTSANGRRSARGSSEPRRWPTTRASCATRCGWSTARSCRSRSSGPSPASTAEGVADLLEAAGIANALLRDIDGLAEHPQLAARRRWIDYDSPVGTLRALVPPATFVGSSPVTGPIPDVGEHTEAVLAEFGVRADVARVR